MSCPEHIIDIRLNADGFWEPSITSEEKCIHCGMCLKNCAYYTTEDTYAKTEVKGYATWSLNSDIRNLSSSGGTGYEIARFLVGKGFTLCGVQYNEEKGIAEHYLADKIDGLQKSQGSKYIQSYTLGAFSELDFSEGKYVVVGAPCQIASLSQFIKRKKAEDRFVLIDFFCHGVPSMFLWEKYTAEIGKRYGKIDKVQWRNKTTGWHDSYAMQLECDHGVFTSRMSQGDLFYKFFLGHYCLGRQCMKACRFKMTNSYADIRIGDLWGKTYAGDDDGVTGVLAFTAKGQAIMEAMTSIHKESVDSDVVCEGQMRQNALEHPLRILTIKLMKSKFPLRTIDQIVSSIEVPFKVLRKMHIIKY